MHCPTRDIHVTAHVFKKINKKLYCGDSAQNALTNKAKNQTKSAISSWDAWLGIYCSVNIEKHIEVMSSDRLLKCIYFFAMYSFYIDCVVSNLKCKT